MGNTSSSSSKNEPTNKNVDAWKKEFQSVRDEQVSTLKTDKPIKEVLAKNRLNVLYTTWSDISRDSFSCFGSNITDMNFFAVPPSDIRGDDVKNNNNMFINFPTLRPSNYVDEIDLDFPQNVHLKVRNRWGEVVDVTLKDFLANIGHYISDLPEEADWSDETADAGKIQVASQFSVLPARDGCCDLGIKAYGYQNLNLHIVVGPDGSVGWMPEQPGSSKIFFRRGDELATISLQPEKRAEVSKEFFKKKKVNETIAEERKRYKKVENFLYHIQIEMKEKQPEGNTKEEKIACLNAELEKVNAGLGKAEDGKVKKTLSFRKEKLVRMINKLKSRPHASRSVAECCSFEGTGDWSEDEEEFDCAAEMWCDEADDSCDDDAFEIEEEKAPIKSMIKKEKKKSKRNRSEKDEGAAAEPSLLLSRVAYGSKVGTAEPRDCVPQSYDGEPYARAPGVGVRLTKMYYGLAEDGKFTASRVDRFCDQMTFEKRARTLEHVSLVTGQNFA